MVADGFFSFAGFDANAVRAERVSRAGDVAGAAVFVTGEVIDTDLVADELIGDGTGGCTGAVDAGFFGATGVSAGAAVSHVARQIDAGVIAHDLVGVVTRRGAGCICAEFVFGTSVPASTAVIAIGQEIGARAGLQHLTFPLK